MFKNCPTRITTAVLQIGKSYLLCLQQFAKFFGFQEKRRCINVCFSFGGRPQNVLVVFGFFLSKSFSGKGLAKKVAKKENVLRYFRSIFLLKKKSFCQTLCGKVSKRKPFEDFFQVMYWNPKQLHNLKIFDKCCTHKKRNINSSNETRNLIGLQL